jgi:hypothetical protein
MELYKPLTLPLRGCSHKKGEPRILVSYLMEIPTAIPAQVTDAERLPVSPDPVRPCV